jgi:Chemoreceptor zinc-binding domain
VDVFTVTKVTNSNKATAFGILHLADNKMESTMLGLFKRLFDGHDDKTAHAAAVHAVGQGLDLQAAIAAHRNWKLRLDAYLAGHSNEDLRAEHICFDDRCEFGRWIHGPGKAALGHVPGFQRLVADHRMFHYAASNVVALSKAGKVGEALTMLDGPYEAASRSVIAALGQMQALVARPAEARRGPASYQPAPAEAS